MTSKIVITDDSTGKDIPPETEYWELSIITKGSITKYYQYQFMDAVTDKIQESLSDDLICHNPSEYAIRLYRTN